jgi:hypothetical protein
MLENLFGGIAPTDKSRLSGIGADPTKVGIMGDAMTRIQAKNQLPTEISPNQLLKSARESGAMDGELEIAQEIVKYEQGIVGKLAQLDELNLNHSKFMMKTDIARRVAQANHAKEVSRYGLNAAETQVNLDGFQQIYDVQATEIFG